MEGDVTSFDVRAADWVRRNIEDAVPDPGSVRFANDIGIYDDGSWAEVAVSWTESGTGFRCDLDGAPGDGEPVTRMDWTPLMRELAGDAAPGSADLPRPGTKSRISWGHENMQSSAQAAPGSVLPSGITLARSTAAAPVPGIGVGEFRPLFCLHAPAVREWIADAAGAGAAVVVADEGWRNPGGVDSLTVPVAEPDAERVRQVRAGHPARP